MSDTCEFEVSDGAMTITEHCSNTFCMRACPKCGRQQFGDPYPTLRWYPCKCEWFRTFLRRAKYWLQDHGWLQ